jgi:hypothetical protein
MSNAIRRILAKIRQGQRLLLRAQVTLGLLQVAFWLVLVSGAVGVALTLRRRLTLSSSRDATEPLAATLTTPPSANNGAAEG